MSNKSSDHTFRVGIFFNRKNKGSREQVAGIFRFAGNHPGWEPRFFTRPDSARELSKLIGDFRPDGIISGHPDVARIFEDKLQRHIPNVVIDHYADKVPTEADALLFCDDHTVGATVAAEFLRRGFTSFAFAGLSGGIRNGIDSVYSRNEENGFSRALRLHGYAPEVYLETLRPGTWHYQDEDGLVRWLKALPKPCALMAHTDTLAVSIYSACRRAKIKIPSELSIISVGNEESICEAVRPQLTSVELDYRAAGERAAEILDGIMKRKKRLPSPIREKYSALRLEERRSFFYVGRSKRVAATFHESIRREALSGLRLSSLTKGCGKSVRTLQNTYRQTYGMTARESVLRLRLNEAKRLLRDTSTPIGEIALKCGFRTQSALRALFARRFGLSLRDYRRVAFEI